MNAAIPYLAVCGNNALERNAVCAGLRDKLKPLNISIQNGDDAIGAPEAGSLDLCDLILAPVKQARDKNAILLNDEGLDGDRSLFVHSPNDTIEELARRVLLWLQNEIETGPTWGCILIGGASSRMGQPKHLIAAADGKTWLEKTVETLTPFVDQIVFAGKGEIPEPLISTVRLEDAAGVYGPLSGILAAMRYQPSVSWLICACDMPLISAEAVAWLMSMRQAGVWGTVPLHPHSGRLQPLFAHYDFRSLMLFEKLYYAENLRITSVCNESKIATPTLPQAIAAAWRNCNTPDDLKCLD